MSRVIAVAVVLLGSAAHAQLQQPTTIQLPTFSYFTVSTTVLVPDGGGAYLGGISRSQSGSRERGVPLGGKMPFASPLFRNRGIASTQAGGGMSVHATIIDHQEIDAAVLEEGLARRGLPASALEPPPVVVARPTSNAAAGVSSLAEIRREQAAADAAQDSAREREAREYFTKATAYDQAGQAGLAKHFYRLAADRSPGELRAQARSRLAALESGNRDRR